MAVHNITIQGCGLSVEKGHGTHAACTVRGVTAARRDVRSPSVERYKTKRHGPVVPLFVHSIMIQRSPGTGVMSEALAPAASKSTSPTSR